MSPYEIRYPEGDGFLLYLAWRQEGSTYLFRVEDLMNNLATGRSMRRHRWVYIGSRFAPLREGGEEVFMADAELNLINVAFFHEGNTLVTAGLPECLEQTIWVANSWLVPPAGSAVQLIFARGEITDLGEEWSAALPEVPGAEPDADDGGAGTGGGR